MKPVPVTEFETAREKLLAEVYKDTPLWAAAAQSAPIEWPA